MSCPPNCEVFIAKVSEISEKLEVIYMKSIFEKKSVFILSKGIFKQNWRAKNMPVVAGHLVYVLKKLIRAFHFHFHGNFKNVQVKFLCTKKVNFKTISLKWFLK